MGDVEQLRNEAINQQHLRWQNTMSLIPYRDWRPLYINPKSQTNHHKKGALKEQSLAQWDVIRQFNFIQ
eukprot:1327833-Amphidinium_carterae.1